MEHLRDQWRKTAALTLREGMETQFGEYRLVYTTQDQGETKPRHLVTAYLGSERVGNLEWYGRTGEVYEIVVRADHRRRGLATAMWDFAQDAPKKPKHSPQRTNDGEAWSKSVGGPRPRRSHASSGAQIEAWSDRGYELARGGWASNVSVVARIGGQAVGFLYADTVDRSGSIEKIWVHPDHRRKGIATEMLRAAERQVGFKIDHGHELSQSGAAWAEQVSGRPARPTYRGDGEFGYMIDQFDRESPSRRTGALSLEDVISVAEEAMERSGNAGKTIHVPVGHMDDPEYQAALAPLVDWVRSITKTNVRFYASDYQLNQEGGAQAMTDGYNKIVVRPVTNEMTVLHECAHVIRATDSGRGHDAAFAKVLHELYRTHIGPRAAEVFWGLVGPRVEGS